MNASTISSTTAVSCPGVFGQTSRHGLLEACTLEIRGIVLPALSGEGPGEGEHFGPRCPEVPETSMGLLKKVEYPPLLKPGLYRLTLEDVFELCVQRFPASTTRPLIMKGLREVVRRLEESGIEADLLVDGSFLTSKENPEDVDVALKVDIRMYESGTPEQKAVLEQVNAGFKSELLCDTYVFFAFPESDERARMNPLLEAYWIKQFGFSRGESLKGIAVLVLGGKK